MLSNDVLELARRSFPGAISGGFDVLPIEKGGSGRQFFRVRAAAGHSLIVVSYHHGREENKHYVDLARFLAEVGVNVPTVYHHDPDQRLIFMEDLGETDLWHYRNEQWSELSALYRSAVQQMVRLHAGAAPQLPSSRLKLQLEFDQQLYLWEQNYFFENCLQAVFQVPPAQAHELASLPRLQEAAKELAGLPRVIVHRDFQSQNVLIDRGSAWLIDFQGMRPGLPQYDLASLVYDPYVNLLPQQREEVIEAYREEAEMAGLGFPADFGEILDLCAMQRLMQALGAYGFLGLQQQRPDFLQHVAPARENLLTILLRISGLEPLHETLQALPVHHG